ncbi:MAG: hypothetical protein QM703_18705 [Gemmatales bacterium]
MSMNHMPDWDDIGPLQPGLVKSHQSQVKAAAGERYCFFQTTVKKDGNETKYWLYFDAYNNSEWVRIVSVATGAKGTIKQIDFTSVDATGKDVTKPHEHAVSKDKTEFHSHQLVTSITE